MVYGFLILELSIMDNTPLNTLMIALLQRATAAFPDLRAQLDAYLDMKAKADERDEVGKLTAAARKAREFLRNALLLQMPLKRALRQYEKAVRQRRAKAYKKVAEALVEFVGYDQYQIELDILRAENPAIDADVPRSRERADQDKLDAMVRPFVEALVERGIAPSTIGRLGDLEKDLIAKLIIDRRDDPDLEKPENLWLEMSRAGILDAYAGAMTSEEASAIELARANRKDDGAAAEFARTAREECGLPAGFSTRFLEGIYHLKASLAEVSEGQARAYARATRLVHDRDVELLGRVLGLTEQSDLDRLQALVHFLTQRRVYETRDTALTIQLVAVQKEFNRLEAHNRSTDDWARDVPKMITSLAEDFADTVPGEEAFEMLLASGFRLSSTYENVQRSAELRAEEERLDRFLDDIRFACSVEQRFKVVGDTVNLEWDEGFENIDAKVWDQASWEAEHGPLFDSSITEDEVGNQHASDAMGRRDALDETGPGIAPGEGDVSSEDGPKAPVYPTYHASGPAPVEPTSAGSADLPVVVAAKHSDSPSLFDFEQSEKPKGRSFDAAEQRTTKRSWGTQKPRPMPPKTIDQLTDEDFR
ncbi:MAG: hypothetical protein ACI8QU_001443 [Devosia litorisediminis]